MSKKFFIILFAILTMINVICTFSGNKINSNVDELVSRKSKNTLSMMLETEQGSGTYEVSKTGEWPDSEYEFNSELSKCENGGELSWDESKNSVIMMGNSSDKCYLYFDKIDGNLPKPTTPSIAFDDNYNVIIYGSTSENGDVEYYYSFDNVTFTSGSTVAVNNSSVIYAYAKDVKKRKSDVVSKNVTINSPVNGSVTSSVYCSKNNTYQADATCSYEYDATRTNNCSGRFPTAYNGVCVAYYDDKFTSTASCKERCILYNAALKGNSFTCDYAPSDDEGTTRVYECIVYSKTEAYSYTCPDGGTLSDTKCNDTYDGVTKYKCSVSNEYYDDETSASAGCTNYCANGTYYNGKCYKLS